MATDPVVAIAEVRRAGDHHGPGVHHDQLTATERPTCGGGAPPTGSGAGRERHRLYVGSFAPTTAFLRRTSRTCFSGSGSGLSPSVAINKHSDGG